MRLFRFIGSTLLRTIAALVVMLLGLLAGLLIRPDWFTPVLSHATHAISGLEVELDSIETRTAPVRIEIGSLRIRNPQWPEPELLRLSRLELSLHDWPAIDKPFWRMRIADADIHVAQDVEGNLNWIPKTGKLTEAQEKLAAEMPSIEAPVAPGAVQLPTDFNFESVEISNVTLHWRNAAFADTVELRSLALQRQQSGRARLHVDLLYQDTTLALQSVVDIDPQHDDRLQLQLEASAAGITVQSSGVISLAPKLAGTALRLSANADNLQQLAALLDTELPAFEQLSMATRFSIDGGYQLNDLRLAIGDNRIEGKLETDFAFRSIDSELRSERLDIDAILAALPATEQKPPSVGETAIPWSDIQQIAGRHRIQVGRLQYEQWAISEMAVSIRHDQRFDVSATLTELLGAPEPIRNIDLTATATPLSAATGPDLDIALDIESDLLGIGATGPLNINGSDGTRLKLRAGAEQTAPLWRLAGQPWLDAGAIKLDAAFGSDASGQTIKGLLQLGDGRADLDLALGTGEPRPLSGTLTARDLDLAFLSPPANPTADKGGQPVTDRNAPLFSDDAIDFSVLTDFSGQLEIDLLNIRSPGPLLTKANLKPVIGNGKVSLSDGRIQLGTGEIQLDFDADASSARPRINLVLQARNLSGAELGLGPADAGGVGNGDIYLRSSGSSAKQLAANAAGSIDIRISDLTAAAGALNIVGGDIFNETLNALNPLRKKDPRTNFECIAVKFDGDNGKFSSDGELIVETDRMKVVGTGFVDLRRERLDISLSPVAKRGLGVNLSTLVQMVKLGGPLRSPGVRANVGGMLNSGLSTTAALSTGGLSLLAESLVKRAINQGSPCDPASKPEEFIVAPDEQVPELIEIPMPGSIHNATNS